MCSNRRWLCKSGVVSRYVPSRQEAIESDSREAKGLPGQGVVLDESDGLGTNRARERGPKKKRVRDERE